MQFFFYIAFLVIIGVAIFAILYAVHLGVGDDSAMQVVVLTVGVAVILALLVGFNALKRGSKVTDFRRDYLLVISFICCSIMCPRQ